MERLGPRNDCVVSESAILYKEVLLIGDLLRDQWGILRKGRKRSAGVSREEGHAQHCGPIRRSVPPDR